MVCVFLGGEQGEAEGLNCNALQGMVIRILGI